jgi:sugar lactone lactonase YvrE
MRREGAKNAKETRRKPSGFVFVLPSRSSRLRGKILQGTRAMIKKRMFAIGLMVGLLSLAAHAQAENSDGLSKILVPGEDWQVVADGIGFADGASADAEGNFYFSDLKSKPPAVYKVAPDGKTRTKIADIGMSGTKIGPDGMLWACGGGKVVRINLADGTVTTKAENLKTNDIAVNHRGQAYITETAKHQVTMLDFKANLNVAADVGITAPNGIGFSPDQKTLIVSDYGGLNVYTFTVADDGTLSNKKPAMTMKAPENKPKVANGDGMTIDTAGRAYVTTALGLQIFDADGTLLGILPKPQPGLTNAAFAGPDRSYLYITCGTKVFRRKTQAKGSLAFEPPANGN